MHLGELTQADSLALRGLDQALPQMSAEGQAAAYFSSSNSPGGQTAHRTQMLICGGLGLLLGGVLVSVLKKRR
jgi:hypothetical protein